MKHSTAILAVSSVAAFGANQSHLVTRTRSGAVGDAAVVPCYDLPGSLVTCGSHCWPNCEAHKGGAYPSYMDYNHYIVIPEARSCYIDTIDYGRFDAFLSKNSKLTVTIDTYVPMDGVCVLD